MYVWVLLNLLLGLLGQIPPAQAEHEPSVFQQPETQVVPAPDEPRRLELPAGERLVDFAASPEGPEVAIFTRSGAGRARVLLWKIASGQTETIWDSDGHFAPRALAWHPVSRALFLLGASGSESSIVRLEGTPAGWKPTTIFRTKNSLSRLIVGPRPFVTDTPDSRRFYRLFFGEARGQGTFSIASVTDQGERYYPVIHAKGAEPPAPLAPDEIPPSPIVAEWALPEAFHPAGHILLWVDHARCFQAAHYGGDRWEKSTPVWGGKICGGSIEPTPNGIGLLHWRKGTPGVALYLSGQEKPTQQATQHNFTSVPLSTRDGRGLIGATKQGDTLSMVYTPIDVPLANVSNAWMFLESPGDRALMVQHAGLFRTLKGQNQLFQLYDSENYYCGGYNISTPTRPYLVTTDIFWENFAAAYEGLFILLERRQAIPAFWQFVREANAALDKTNSPWAGIFHALDQVASKAMPDDPEAQRIMRGGGVEYSPVLNGDFNYGDLKPRGHYTAGDQEQRYFKAFRYLTSVASQFKKLPAGQLSSLPPAAQEHAREWIRPYLTFIAPSRAPLVWTGLPGAAPPYARHPTPQLTLFPLSWGFDNEVLLSTVFHPDWPADERIIGPGGLRLLPSGVDVAAALGNHLAQTLLRPEIEKYPPLARDLDDLKARAPVAGTYPPSNLYDRWIEALGTSWADSTAIPGEKATELWDVKRLQTGLASWATLRHATVLVNERAVAECGEGGFEWIVLTPPRGYVEPAPGTLEAIAGLFDAAARAVRDSSALDAGDLPSETEKVALREGLLRRLSEASAKARVFAGIARKEIKGEPLSAGEYEEILNVGRTAEYHFLIFKSLANPEFALSNPESMAKVADVAGGAGGIPYLECAVGAPLEWDQIVPYFGRREVVKGSVYSYYEFRSASPLSDADWRARLAGEARPSWVTAYVSNETLSCPSRNPY
jgi:hypothetical protein